MPYYLLNTEDAGPNAGKVLHEHETPDAAKADRSAQIARAQKMGVTPVSMVVVQTTKQFRPAEWVPKDAVLRTFN